MTGQSFPSPSQDAPVDRACLEAFRSLQEPGEPDVVVEFVTAFLDDLPGRRSDIQRALGGGDLEKTRATAHGLKGSASYIGARHLAGLCASLEHASREGKRDTAVAAAECLEVEAERVSSYLRQVVEAGGVGPAE